MALEKGHFQEDIAGIDLQIQRVSHGEAVPNIQNLGQIIRVGGVKLLHVGDSYAPKGDFQSFQWEKENLDVAFLPFWYLAFDEGKALVEEHIRPKWIVAMHIPPSELDKWKREIEMRFPRAMVFSHAMEKKVIPGTK